ncbi:hypothetical protein AMTRI_Chr04g189880 [Amborella trichopoda]
MEVSHFLSFLMVILLTLSVTAPSFEAHVFSLNNLTDQQALLSLKDHITFDPYNIFGEWNINTSVCNWIEVSCSKQRQRGHLLQFYKHRIARYTHTPHRESSIFASSCLAKQQVSWPHTV